ncbi:substrate-binding periplasmic protein [Chitinimonas koreensis]|uniref:substrate-binding periplasmic protein n=1 Tax=Chitinimonas koreensis TaxID=356302 RepID=UPI000415979F|nr:transporter substrate-binding domain-containing protein [Chitinimonas koreensis]QNM97234.1 transporter substrate-binding domain-containing protein [Chitinimonas koreensis]
MVASTLIFRRMPLPVLSALALACRAADGPAPAVPAAPGIAETVRACGGEGEWIPSSYFAREHGRKTEAVVGYSVDVLREALAGSRFRPEAALLPWARCQREVRDGRRFQLAMGVLYSQERAREYLLSEPYLRFRPGYFYWRGRFPAGLSIDSAAELGRYRVCGLYGYNYGYTGLDAGRFDTGALDYPSVVAKLAAGRCDLFVETLEVMAGQRRLGRVAYDPAILVGRPIPGLPPVVAHFAVSPNAPDAVGLVRALDAGIERLRRAQRLDALLSKHTD